MAAIRIRHLGRYFSPPLDLQTSTAGQLSRSLLRIFGFNVAPAAKDDIQRTVMLGGRVLHDISLQIETGSAVFIAGASGAGKSTLLKILAGVVPPTEGRVEIEGRVSALLSIGDNLDSRLTAVENIENHLRLARTWAADVGTYMRDVIAFAELWGFERVPVRTYSTGMTMRLSVSMALHGDPDVLVIDDVLGVGDLAFRQSCIDRLHTLKEAGCTLVMALNDDSAVRQLATRVITLSGGRVVEDGPPPDSLLGQHGFGGTDLAWHISPHLPENTTVALNSIAVEHRGGAQETYLDLSLSYEAKVAPLQCRPSIIVMMGKVVVFRSLFPSNVHADAQSGLLFSVAIPAHLLCTGTYKITMSMQSTYAGVTYALKAFDALTLDVKRGVDFSEQTTLPLTAASMSWEIEAIPTGTL